MTGRGTSGKSIRAFAAATICLAVLVEDAHAGPEHRTSPAAAALHEFDRRVNKYLKLHKEAERVLPRMKPTDSAAAVLRHERALGEQIRQQRPAAKQGDIFTPAIAGEFRRLIAVTMQGTEAARVQQSLRNAEPVKAEPRINEVYPASLPRQSTPPSLLLNLPKLPPELAYSIVGHDLVLRDVAANLTVDFIPSAIP